MTVLRKLYLFNAVKDRRGFEYEDLVQTQRDHLVSWSERLVPAIFVPVSEYVISQNRSAAHAEDLHRVYRGQDLIEIIRQWPDLHPPYEKPTATLDDV